MLLRLPRSSCPSLLYTTRSVKTFKLNYRVRIQSQRPKSSNPQLSHSHLQFTTMSPSSQRRGRLIKVINIYGILAILAILHVAVTKNEALGGEAIETETTIPQVPGDPLTSQKAKNSELRKEVTDLSTSASVLEAPEQEEEQRHLAITRQNPMTQTHSKDSALSAHRASIAQLNKMTQIVMAIDTLDPEMRARIFPDLSVTVDNLIAERQKALNLWKTLMRS